MPRIVDLSQAIAADMPVYPGDDGTEVTQTRYLDRDWHNNHRLTIGMHAGTHIDSPMHLLPSDVYVSQLPLAPFAGPGCIIDVRDQPVIRWRTAYEAIIKPGSIVLLYTGHDQWYGSSRYFHEHPQVDPDFCNFLLQQEIKMLGMDLPSPDAPPFPVHKRLLSNGIYVLENLTNLAQLLDVPEFEVMALPLKIEADGSPVRAAAFIR